MHIAKTPPTVDVLYYPGQDYPAKTWSAWGDGLAIGDKYYSSIGDHEAPSGNAFVYEYDAKQKSIKQLVDVKKLLKLPAGHYTPGKIHSRIDLGSDGWLYFATHRGSTPQPPPKTISAASGFSVIIPPPAQPKSSPTRRSPISASPPARSTPGV